LRLTDLTLNGSEIIGPIMKKSSLDVEVSSFDVPSFLSMLAYDCHCAWQITVTRRDGCFFKVAWYCFMYLKLIVWTAIEVSRRDVSFNCMPETETENYTAFVCVWDEHACMHVSPCLYDFIHLFSFDSKLTCSLAYGECSGVWLMETVVVFGLWRL
jgi:hypothetical protein